MSTIAAFMSSVAGVAISGVNRQYVYPPASLNTADLPASYVTPPQGGRGGAFFAFDNDTDRVRRCELVICVEPVGQGTQAANFAAMVAMADAVEDAIDAYGPPWGITVDYTIDTGTAEVGGVAYWAVITTVTAQGDV